jgi:MarR family transcriptional regulator, temperature-dependent positive regulator of motility|tara:strand:- start:88 stop:477 length:390 start_codon:yes stop_codon:yes gene_type:complete
LVLIGGSVAKLKNKNPAEKILDPDLHFRALKVLQENPELSQRELAKIIGVSLGSINYCLKALVAKGQIKINNFKRNTDKTVYLYLLTPSGISEKARLTSGFLKRKLIEYDLLKREIDALQSIRQKSIRK